MPVDARRSVVLVTLIAFVTGSIGLPVYPPKTEAAESPFATLTTHDSPPIAHAAPPQASSLKTQASSCCCSRKSKPCSCGCRHRAATARVTPSGGSCCAKRPTPTKQSTSVPVVSCPCSGSPQGDQLVSAQPKLGTPEVCFGRCDLVSAVTCSDDLRRPDRTLAPPAPPPRPFVD